MHVDALLQYCRDTEQRLRDKGHAHVGCEVIVNFSTISPIRLQIAWGDDRKVIKGATIEALIREAEAVIAGLPGTRELKRRELARRLAHLARDAEALEVDLGALLGAQAPPR